MTTAEQPSHRGVAAVATLLRGVGGASLPALLAVAAVLVVFTAVRWTGVLPYGSDADEYPIVARALLDRGEPVVGEVEGTKYPLGYPVVLAALFAMRLPPLAGLALNVVLLAGVVTLVAAAARRCHPALAAAAAAIYVAVNAGLWATVSLLMPDTLITFLSALLLWLIVRMESARDVVAVAAVALAATAVKTLGLFIAGAASVGVLLGPRPLRRWFLLPGAAGLLSVGLHTLIMRGYPAPATGYAVQFWSVDPYDAAAGRAGVGEVMARLWTRWDVVIGDWGEALAGPHVPRALAIAIALVLLASGLWGLESRWGYGLGLLLVYGAGLALWPFTSVRFGLPLIPLAALGVARLTRAVLEADRQRLRAAGVAVVCSLLALHLMVSLREVGTFATAEAAVFVALSEQTAEAARWAERNIPADEDIASPAYRELYERFDRRILPVAYTRDPEALWEQTGGGGAEWVANLTTLYPRRARLSRILVRAYPERFDKVFENDGVVIYRITTPDSN